MGSALSTPVESLMHSTIYHPPTCQYTYSDCNFVKTESGLQIAWQFVTRDAEVDRRWNAKQEYTDSRKLYLFSHGNACDISTCNVEWAVKSMNANVLKWDYPGYGQSTDKYACEQSICESVQAMYYLCAKMKVPADKLVIVGQSLGTVPSLFLASRCHTLNVHAVLLISPLASGYRTMFTDSRYCPRTVTRFMDSILFDNIKHASGVRVPVAIIHGLNDEVISFSHVEVLMQQFPAHAKYPPLELDASHNDILSPQHETAITDYLRRFLLHCDASRPHTTPYDD